MKQSHQITNNPARILINVPLGTLGRGGYWEMCFGGGLALDIILHGFFLS